MTTFRNLIGTANFQAAEDLVKSPGRFSYGLGTRLNKCRCEPRYKFLFFVETYLAALHGIDCSIRTGTCYIGDVLVLSGFYLSSFDLEGPVMVGSYVSCTAQNLGMIQTKLGCFGCSLVSSPTALNDSPPDFCHLLYKSHYYTPGRGKIVPRNVTLLVGEKLCRVMLHSW